MKRFVSTLLSLMMFFSTLQISVLASNKSPPKITVDSVNASAGETIVVNVNLENNPGIVSACINVAFDSGLTLIGATNGNVFPSSITFTRPKQLSTDSQIMGNCNFIWSGADIANKDIKDGVMLTLTFAVSDKAKNGDSYKIAVTSRKSDIVDKNLTCIELEPATGKVNIADGDSVTDNNESTANLFSSLIEWLRNIITKLKEILSKIKKV